MPSSSVTLEDVRALLAPLMADVREARDGMIKLTQAFNSLDTNARLDALASAMKAEHTALRQDVVTALSGVRTDLKEVEGRVESLEEDRERRDGGFSLLRALRESVAWFVALGVSALAIFDHLRPPHPPH